MRINTASSYDGFAFSCTRHSRSEEAKLKAKNLRCDDLWSKALSDATLDGFERFVRSCPSQPQSASARSRADAIRANPLDIPGLPPAGSPIPREGLSASNNGHATSCENGQASSCAFLGYQFDVGQGAPTNPQWSAALYARACGAGNENGCGNLGRSLVSGEGTRKDPARARILNARACNSGEKFACTNLGILYENGRGGQTDYKSAAELYERACDTGKTGGSARGCLYAAELYENGRKSFSSVSVFSPSSEVVKDTTKALQLTEAGLRLTPSDADLLALKERLTPRPSNIVCNSGPYIVYFGSGKSDITREAAIVLDTAFAAYQSCRPQQLPNLTMAIAGHTDRLGASSRNLSLSTMRANNVATYLRRKLDPLFLNRARPIKVEGFGETQPRVPTADGIAEPLNNRVEIRFTPSAP